MSASTQEVQEHTDAILALIGARIVSGKLVIHFDQGHVQRCEVQAMHKLKGSVTPLRKSGA